MKDETILSIIGDELSNSEKNLDFETPLDYYLGNPLGNEVEGRSQVVSMDVADAIEWIMPQIMKSFTQNNEIVVFDPIGPMDEQQAEMESQYVYDVIMKENDGFIILYQFVKDALLQKNGYIKVYYEDTSKEESYDFTGMSMQQFQMALMHPHVEVSSKTEYSTIDEATQQPVQLVDTRLTIKVPNGKIVLESVPPEDFRCSSDHNSVSLDKAKFTAHLMTSTVGELLADGVSQKTIDLILEETDERNDSDYRFTSMGESVDDETPIDDKSRTKVYLAECYLLIDINDDGKSEYCKVLVGGQYTPTVVIEYEELDYNPWISVTPIIMSHTHRGLSIFDRLKQIQEQKTSLLRNTLDNIYLQNNQRHLVMNNLVEMADLLASRPGGIIRVKNLDAVRALPTPALGDASFSMMAYLDGVRSGRAGVSPEGEAHPQRVGERVGSEGLERLMTAKEELVGLIVRVVAEVGIKPLCIKIRDLCTRHLDAIQDYRYRGTWVKVNPGQWKSRTKTTVRVGTGTGNHMQQLASIREVLGIQEKLGNRQGQALVDDKRAFKALDDFCKFSGLNSATGYFIDPNTPEGQQKAKQVAEQSKMQQDKADKMQAIQMEFQSKLANAETEKASANMKNVELRKQVEDGKLALAMAKEESTIKLRAMEMRIDQLQQALKSSGESADLTFKKDQEANKVALELTRLELEQKTQGAEKEFNDNKEQSNASGS